ncbi:MAG: hypothetical protein OSJ43_16425 [Oscillospiraceae bacterium]|nr:hypothetical protein [Oscillospiraceae bacterium]
MEKIYNLAINYKVKSAKSNIDLSVKFYELAKKACLILARELFHYYLIYVEWNRFPEKKFYIPRMAVLRKAVDSLQDLYERKIKKLVISLPPRVGKSTLGMFFVTWIAGKDPEGSSALGGYSSTLTDGFFDEIFEIITSEEYLWADVFPNCQIAGKSLELSKLCLNRDRRFGTVTCRGIDASWTGIIEVSQLLYLDDLIKDWQEAINPARLESKYQQYLNIAKDRKKESAVELHIGTRWAVDDPIGRVIEQYADDPEVRVIVIPAVDENGESNFDYPYGLGFSTAYYKDMRESLDPWSWSCKFMGDPYVREGLLFDSENLNYYNGTLPDGECDVKSAVDVAFGGGDSLSAPIIYWFGNLGYVHDWVFSDKDKTVTQPLVVDRFVANDVGRSKFEANAGGRAYAEDIEKQLKERGHHCSVTTSSANVRESKDNKILRYSTDIRDRLVFRNDAARGAMYDKAMSELCRYSVNTSGKKIKRHDDAADSLAMNIDFHQNGLCTVEIIENKFL